MMKRLVDTSVWSLALRRHTPPSTPVVQHFAKLLEDLSVGIIGPIRQELLTGIRELTQFERLKEKLAILPDEPILPVDYVTAASLSNTCRAHGVQGSHTDFLICAVSLRNSWPILTTDMDFHQYARYLPIQLDEGII